MKSPLLRAACLGLALVSGLLGSLPARAGTLEATIVGRSDVPKQYVRVEVFGPQNRTLFTDQAGKLSLELPGGHYTVRITERNRQMDFEIAVPDRGVVAPKLALEW